MADTITMKQELDAARKKVIGRFDDIRDANEDTDIKGAVITNTLIHGDLNEVRKFDYLLRQSTNACGGDTTKALQKIIDDIDRRGGGISGADYVQQMITKYNTVAIYAFKDEKGVARSSDARKTAVAQLNGTPGTTASGIGAPFGGVGVPPTMFMGVGAPPVASAPTTDEISKDKQDLTKALADAHAQFLKTNNNPAYTAAVGDLNRKLLSAISALENTSDPKKAALVKTRISSIKDAIKMINEESQDAERIEDHEVKDAFDTFKKQLTAIRDAARTDADVARAQADKEKSITNRDKAIQTRDEEIAALRRKLEADRIASDKKIVDLEAQIKMTQETTDRKITEMQARLDAQTKKDELTGNRSVRTDQQEEAAQPYYVQLAQLKPQAQAAHQRLDIDRTGAQDRVAAPLVYGQARQQMGGFAQRITSQNEEVRKRIFNSIVEEAQKENPNAVAQSRQRAASGPVSGIVQIFSGRTPQSALNDAIHGVAIGRVLGLLDQGLDVIVDRRHLKDLSPEECNKILHRLKTDRLVNILVQFSPDAMVPTGGGITP